MKREKNKTKTDEQLLSPEMVIKSVKSVGKGDVNYGGKALCKLEKVSFESGLEQRWNDA